MRAKSCNNRPSPGTERPRLVPGLLLPHRATTPQGLGFTSVSPSSAEGTLSGPARLHSPESVNRSVGQTSEPWEPAFRKLHKHPSEKQKSNLKAPRFFKDVKKPFLQRGFPIPTPLFQHPLRTQQTRVVSVWGPGSLVPFLLEAAQLLGTPPPSPPPALVWAFQSAGGGGGWDSFPDTNPPLIGTEGALSLAPIPACRGPLFRLEK